MCALKVAPSVEKYGYSAGRVSTEHISLSLRVQQHIAIIIVTLIDALHNITKQFKEFEKILVCKGQA